MWEQLDIGPLSDAAMTAIAAHGLDEARASALREVITQTSQGHPFFALELLRFARQGNVTTLAGCRCRLR